MAEAGATGKRLSDAYLRSLAAPATGRLVVPDKAVEGLSLRITAKGARSWLVRYRPRRQKQRATVLGPYPSMSLADARERASAIVSAAKRGVDLIAEERRAAEEAAEAERRAQERARSVETVAEDFLKHCKARLKSWRQVDSWVRNHIVPEIGTQVVGDIQREHIVELLDKMQLGQGLRQTVNRVRETLLGLFAFAVERGYVDQNPVAGAKRRKVEVKRKRVLSRDEIRALWLGVNGLPDPGRSFVRLLLLTGCRREEARRMRWSELDLDAALWRIPGERTKNGHDHEVPLSGRALEILKTLPVRGPFVFTIDGKRPLAGMSGLKERIDRASGLAGWRLHDLRRTLRSGIAEMGVAYEVAERVIGHTMPALDQTYNVHTYLAEKRAALDRWANHVQAITDGQSAKEAVH